MADDRPSRAPHRLLAFLVLAAAAIAIGIASRPAPDEEEQPATSHPPDVIVIVVSGLRAGALTCFGAAADKSPEIDRFAVRSVLFDHCFTPCPRTLPACASLLTGARPAEHGVYDDQGFVMHPELQTLPQLLNAKGYTSGAFTCLSDQGEVTRDFGLDYHCHDKGVFTCRDILGRCSRWLGGVDDSQAALAFVHLPDLEAPFWPSKPEAYDVEMLQYFNAEEIVPLYEAEVHEVDRELGKFFARLQELGRFDNSIIVLTSDHGQALGHGQELTNGYGVSDGSTHVPLIVKYPDNEFAATRSSAMAQGIDVLPTICSRLDIAWNPLRKHAFAARDLTRLLVEGETTARPAYIENVHPFLSAGLAKARALRYSKDMVLFSGSASFYYKLDYPEVLSGPNYVGTDKETPQIKQRVTSARVALMNYLDTGFLPAFAPHTPIDLTFDLNVIGNEPLGEKDHLNDDSDRVAIPHAMPSVAEYQNAYLEW